MHTRKALQTKSRIVLAVSFIWAFAAFIANGRELASSDMTTNGGLATRIKFWFGIKVEVDGKHYILQVDIPPYEGHESNIR